jgi:hypothetical protein
MASRRIVLAVGFVVLFCGTAVVALTSPAEEDSAFVWAKTKWRLESISKDQRHLTLGFPSGGCTYDKGRAHLAESRDVVRISVEARNPQDDRLCTGDLRVGQAVVRLRRRLDGRRVLGGTRIGSLEFVGGRAIKRGYRYIQLVPRVAGLSVLDARRLLEAHGFNLSRDEAGDEKAIAVGTQPSLGIPVLARKVTVLSR